MTIRRRSGLKYKALLLVGMLTMSSWGCSYWDNPGYVYGSGVATGVMGGLISVSVAIVGQTIGDLFFSGQEVDDGTAATG